MHFDRTLHYNSILTTVAYTIAKQQWRNYHASKPGGPARNPYQMEPLVQATSRRSEYHEVVLHRPGCGILETLYLSFFYTHALQHFSLREPDLCFLQSYREPLQISDPGAPDTTLRHWITIMFTYLKSMLLFGVIYAVELLQSHLQ